MLPQRKHTRLKDYDYSRNGAYFVTICTKDKKPLLGKIVSKCDNINTVGRPDPWPPDIILSNIGTIVDKYINGIDVAYKYISVSKYVIMPNHIHMIVKFEFPLNNGGQGSGRPTLHSIIHGFKNLTTKEVRFPIWQSSYYEHIIRNEKSYQEIWKYIDDNPLKWHLDELYVEEKETMGM